MRTYNDILTDVCVAFDSDIETFSNRGNKRVNEHMSLINQAFILIAMNTFCTNLTILAKYLNRSPASVSVAYQKAQMLARSQNPYAMNFKERVMNSCEEGRKIIEEQYV